MRHICVCIHSPRYELRSRVASNVSPSENEIVRDALAKITMSGNQGILLSPLQRPPLHKLVLNLSQEFIVKMSGKMEIY